MIEKKRLIDGEKQKIFENFENFQKIERNIILILVGEQNRLGNKYLIIILIFYIYLRQMRNKKLHIFLKCI